MQSFSSFDDTVVVRSNCFYEALRNVPRLHRTRPRSRRLISHQLCDGSYFVLWCVWIFASNLVFFFEWLKLVFVVHWLVNYECE